jgi:hypothetical protein
MCLHSKEQAKLSGFRAMQFNFVVSTNERAVKLWQALGFEIVGTLPAAFEHPSKGFVDAFVMFALCNCPERKVHAARAIAETGPGSHGFDSRGASSMIRSDPHNPHRSTDVEIVSQAWQYTALSTGIETSPGFDRIIMTFRIDAPVSGKL